MDYTIWPLVKNLYFVLGWYRAFSIDLPSLECYLYLQVLMEVELIGSTKIDYPKPFRNKLENPFELRKISCTLDSQTPVL